MNMKENDNRQGSVARPMHVENCTTEITDAVLQSAERVSEEIAFAVNSNQATSEEAAISRAKTHSDRLKLTLTLRQIVLIIIVLSTIGRATSGRWWFDYKTGVSDKLMAANLRVMTEKLRLAENRAVELGANLKNLHWLWHSHNINIALMEDDSHTLESTDDNGVNAFEFLQKATSIRRNGFLTIALDDNHPNLRAWLEKNAPEQLAVFEKDRKPNRQRRSIIAELRSELADKTADHKNTKLFMFSLLIGGAPKPKSAGQQIR